MKWSTAASHDVSLHRTKAVESRAGSALRGPRTHQKPLVCLPLVQSGSAAGGLAGCYFEHCRSAEHSPRCRPDSTETWRGKPGPNWAALPRSSPYSLMRTWAMGILASLEKAVERRRLGGSGDW